MLLDRNLIVDLIVVEFERETEYRHPPLYIVTLVWREFRQEEQESASRELRIEHPCTDIELIEKAFDSISWLCVYSLCVLMLCL
jgi:hypothetical protein